MEPSTHEAEASDAAGTASPKEADKLQVADRVGQLEERVARLESLLDERVTRAPVNINRMATTTPLPETNIMRLIPYNLAQTDECNVVLKSSTNQSLETLRERQSKRAKYTHGLERVCHLWQNNAEFSEVDNYARSHMILSGGENKINVKFSDKSKAFCVGVVQRKLFTKGNVSNVMLLVRFGGIFTSLVGKDSIDIRVDFDGDCQLQLHSYGIWRCVNEQRINPDVEWCWCVMFGKGADETFVTVTQLDE